MLLPSFGRTAPYLCTKITIEPPEITLYDKGLTSIPTSMALNKFVRYFWLVDLLRRRKRLTYNEIVREWEDECDRHGYDKKQRNLPKRTFNNHRVAVQEMFDINIDCDPHDGYRYYIENIDLLNSDELRLWFVDSFSALNQVQLHPKLEHRIQFEDIPSGHDYLAQVIEAMRINCVLRITYKSFGKDFDNTFDIEPYAVKVFARRWYVIARSPYYSRKDGEDVILTYALDRVLSLQETDKTFEMPRDFNVKEYFQGSYGIINDHNIEVKPITIKAWYPHCNYLETLPLHESQTKIAEDDESRTYQYKMRPTFDLYQALLAQTDLIEVLDPPEVREELARFAENMLNHYKPKQ